MKILSRVDVPADVPRIALEVRLIDGVPVVFTARGEMVSGQIAVSVKGEVGEGVVAKLRFYPEKK